MPIRSGIPVSICRPLIVTMVAMLLLLIPIINGCSDTTRESGTPWRFDPSQTGAPVLQGVYSVTLEIREDTCRPSLEEMTSTERWPPEAAPLLLTRPIGSHTPHRAPHDKWSTNWEWFDLRGGTLSTADAVDVEPSGHVGQQPLYSDKSYNPARWLAQVQCDSGSMPSSIVTGKSPTRETLELSVETRWRNLDECFPNREQLEGWNAFALPEEACRESYVLRYRLQDQCPKETCHVAEFGTPKNDKPFSYVPNPDDADDPCVCIDDTNSK